MAGVSDTRAAIVALAVLVGAGCRGTAGVPPAGGDARGADAAVADAGADAASETPDAGGAAVVAPSTAGVTASIRGRTVELRHGVAYVDPLQLHVYLASAPVTCDHIADEVATLHVQIPPGPDRRYYAGGAIGVMGFFQGPGVPPTANAGDGGEIVVTVDEVGDRVRGAVALDATKTFDHPPSRYRARGSFDVVICGGATALARGTGLPAQAPATPVAGTLDGYAFTARSALAHVERGARGVPTLRQVELFEAADASCDRAGDARPGWSVRITSPTGVVSDPRYRGPQPASAVVLEPGSDRRRGLGGEDGRAWLRVDRVRAQPGAIVTGELVAASGQPRYSGVEGEIAGRFRATVCLHDR